MKWLLSSAVLKQKFPMAMSVQWQHSVSNNIFDVDIPIYIRRFNHWKCKNIWVL